MKHRILKREQINVQLHNIFNYPLTVVVAAMGYGKTTSVRAFLEETAVRYAWLSVEGDETSASYIWQSLTRQLSRTEPKLGNRLKTLGFPADAPQRDRVIEIVEDYVDDTITVLVIDDYHFAHAPELDSLLERIIRSSVKGLHVVILSRTRPELNMEELRLKGYCYLFKSVFFEMSELEILQYFQLFGYDISTAAARQIYVVSEGWIAAVHLIIQDYSISGSLELGRNMESLVETAIMSRYTEQEVRILVSMSIQDSFTPLQAEYITADPAAPGIMQNLSDENSFIRYDEQADIYRMHNIFSKHLNNRLAGWDRNELANLYKRSGKWHVENGDLLIGLRFYLKAKEYDLILQEFEKPPITRLFDTVTRDIVELFVQIPQDVKYRHPLGYLTYVEFFITNVDIKSGAALLAQLEEHYQTDDCIPSSLKKRIDGEIQLIKNHLVFNDLRKMHQQHLKAHKLLAGSSSIFNKDMIFTFGSPHGLYLYHRVMGEMQWIVDFLDENFHYYQEVSNGSGTGFERLARAEYCLETGDFAQAENYARKAIYKAQTMEQASIVICANLTLARLSAARGKFNEARESLDQLSGKQWDYINPVLENSIDLCTGYMAGIMGEPHNFAGWLKLGDMQQQEMLYQGMAFNYIIHAKSVLLEENYLKLEVLCEEMQQLFSIFNNLFGFLHSNLLDTAAKYRLYGLPQAKKPLLKALDIGRADGIILPFAEYGQYILDVLKALQGERENDDYLGQVIMETTRYCTNLQRLTQSDSAKPLLSKREKEILQLIIEGKTSKEIAASLYLAEVTVKKNTSSIYRKLGVRGRVGAVKKAMSLKLT